MSKYYVCATSTFHKNEPCRMVIVTLQPKEISTAQYGYYLAEFAGTIVEPIILMTHYRWPTSERFHCEYQGIKLIEGDRYIDPAIKAEEESAKSRCNKAWAMFSTNGESFTVTFTRQEARPNKTGCVTHQCYVHGDITSFNHQSSTVRQLTKNYTVERGGGCLRTHAPTVFILAWKVHIVNFMGVVSRYISVYSAEPDVLDKSPEFNRIEKSYHFKHHSMSDIVYKRQVMNNGAGKIEFRYQGKDYNFQIPELEVIREHHGDSIILDGNQN